MSENEKHLLDKAKNGDIEAFEKLISSYQKKVFNIALRMIGNREDASELAQEAFIRMYKSIKNFEEKSSFSTWIYKITTNICLDELRKRKNKNIVFIDEDIKSEEGEFARQIPDDGPTPEDVFERKELRKTVLEAINQLGTEQKTVIILRDLNGLSYEEIAEIVKCPEGTVKSRINRARNELKEILRNKLELFNGKHVKISRKEGSK